MPGNQMMPKGARSVLVDSLLYVAVLSRNNFDAHSMELSFCKGGALPNMNLRRWRQLQPLELFFSFERVIVVLNVGRQRREILQ